MSRTLMGKTCLHLSVTLAELVVRNTLVNKGYEGRDILP
jgi:hypothetical protein